jgi:Na+-translocating ferredoxin:NAD+ oxidoreductase subunit B
MNHSLTDQINALLPQTQCQKCGYAGCHPYAEAISQGAADINQCPPGGTAGIQKLAELLGVPGKPLNPDNGEEHPRMLAVINEAECIGCTKCIPPCPVDAIIGAAKHMHSIITHYCTGCELCIAPCPVNCISLQPSPLPSWNENDAALAQQRYAARNQRLAKQEAEKIERQKRQKLQIAKLKTQK